MDPARLNAHGWRLTSARRDQPLRLQQSHGGLAEFIEHDQRWQISASVGREEPGASSPRSI